MNQGAYRNFRTFSRTQILNLEPEQFVLPRTWVFLLYITSLTIVYSTVYSGADQRKHQSSASLAFVWGIHRGPVNSPHKWPVTRKMFPFDDVIMALVNPVSSSRIHEMFSLCPILLRSANSCSLQNRCLKVSPTQDFLSVVGWDFLLIWWLGKASISCGIFWYCSPTKELNW